MKAVSDILLRACRRSRISAKANVEDDEGEKRALSRLVGDTFSTNRLDISLVPLDGTEMNTYPFAQHPFIPQYKKDQLFLLSE